MFTQQIVEMKAIVTLAINSLQHDNLAKAKSLLAKLHRYHPITEKDRCLAIVESLILLKRKKKRKAKECILVKNYAAWGSADLLDILRMCNPAVDKDSRSYLMTIQGGCASFGAFTQFSDEHICDLEIIANSKSEAFQYATELCRFAVPERARIIHFEKSEIALNFEEHRGVLSTSPFRTEMGDKLPSCAAHSIN